MYVWLRFRVGPNHTFLGINGVRTVLLAGNSPYIRSYTVQIHGSGQTYACVFLIDIHTGPSTPFFVTQAPPPQTHITDPPPLLRRSQRPIRCHTSPPFPNSSTCPSHLAKCLRVHLWPVPLAPLLKTTHKPCQT